MLNSVASNVIVMTHSVCIAIMQCTKCPELILLMESLGVHYFVLCSTGIVFTLIALIQRFTYIDILLILGTGIFRGTL